MVEKREHFWVINHSSVFQQLSQLTDNLFSPKCVILYRPVNASMFVFQVKVDL